MQQPNDNHVGDSVESKDLEDKGTSTGVISGGNGLKPAKKFNWKRAVPLVIIIALVGGFTAYKSFAGTYQACQKKDGNYLYSTSCVLDSDEASVVRLYYGALNRAPDKTGIAYWTGRLEGTTGSKQTLSQVAGGFMASPEFSSKYGALQNGPFVKAMYLQVFGRAPDTTGLTYWTNRLNNKTATREFVLTNFTESPEMKTQFTTAVIHALGITVEGTPVNTWPPKCLGTVEKDASGSTWCGIGLRSALASADEYGNVQVGVFNYDFPAGGLFASAGRVTGDTKLKLVNNDGKTSGCGGLSGRSYFGNIATSMHTITANDYGYGGGAGGCDYPNSTLTGAYFNGEGSYDAKAANGFLVSFAAKKAEIEAMPVNAKVLVLMDNIKLTSSPTLNDVAFPTDQTTPAVVSSISRYSQRTVISNKLTTSPSQVAYTPVNKTNSPEWIHITKVPTVGRGCFILLASTVINTGTPASYTARWGVKVYNQDTNQLLDPGTYQLYTTKTTDPNDYTTTSYQKLSTAYTTQTIPSDADPEDQIIITVNQKYPSRLRFEVDASAPADFKLLSSGFSQNYTLPGIN